MPTSSSSRSMHRRALDPARCVRPRPSHDGSRQPARGEQQASAHSSAWPSSAVRRDDGDVVGELGGAGGRRVVARSARRTRGRAAISWSPTCSVQFSSNGHAEVHDAGCDLAGATAGLQDVAEQARGAAQVDLARARPGCRTRPPPRDVAGQHRRGRDRRTVLVEHEVGGACTQARGRAGRSARRRDRPAARSGRRASSWRRRRSARRRSGCRTGRAVDRHAASTRWRSRAAPPGAARRPACRAAANRSRNCGMPGPVRPIAMPPPMSSGATGMSRGSPT